MLCEQRLNARLAQFLAKSPRPLLQGCLYRDGTLLSFTRGAEPAGSPAVFEIGSIGKTLTTTLLALLVRESTVNLEDPVGKYCPEYADLRRITLRQLASHTAGLPCDPLPTWQVLRADPRDFVRFTPRDLDGWLRRPRRLKSCGRFRYSNVGMALLGNILGKALGLSYVEAVMENICRPLGMSQTHFSRSVFAEDQMVVGHDRRARVAPPFQWAGMEGAGLWYSTVADLMTFVKAQLGHAGARWRELAQLTTQNVATIGKQGYVGLGWCVFNHEAGPIALHDGGTFGQHTFAAWALQRDAALVTLTNRAPPLWHSLVISRQLRAFGLDLLEECVAAA